MTKLTPEQVREFKLITQAWLVNAHFLSYIEACDALGLHHAAFVQWRHRGYIPTRWLKEMNTYGPFPLERYFKLQMDIIRNENDQRT